MLNFAVDKNKEIMNTSIFLHIIIINRLQRVGGSDDMCL